MIETTINTFPKASFGHFEPKNILQLSYELLYRRSTSGIGSILTEIRNNSQIIL